eukprot:scaffold84_cov163-Amphora_coffeaeformis.AAC.14
MTFSIALRGRSSIRLARSTRGFPQRRSLALFRQQRMAHTFRQDVIFVRHGETEWNRALRVQGSTDIPLNEKGKAQAQACATDLLRDLFSGQDTPAGIMIYSSPLARALDTARTIARTLSQVQNKNVPVSIANDLKEWNLGVLEGLTKDEASVKYPEDWRIFSQWADPCVPNDDSNKHLTDGESMEQVRWRAVDFVNDIVNTVEKNASDEEMVGDHVVICVTHGGVMGQLLRHVAETTDRLNNENAFKRPTNASISKFTVEYNDTPVEPQWKIKSWADTDHLTGNLAPASANYQKTS